MQQFIDSIIHLWPVLAAIGGGFLAVGKWLAKKAKNENERREKEIADIKAQVQSMRDDEIKSLKVGVQAIIRQNIINNHARYTERRNIPFYGLENCEELFQAYKANGGNSFAHELMKDIRDLPVIKGSQRKEDK